MTASTALNHTLRARTSIKARARNKGRRPLHVPVKAPTQPRAGARPRSTHVLRSSTTPLLLGPSSSDNISSLPLHPPHLPWSPPPHPPPLHPRRGCSRRGRATRAQEGRVRMLPVACIHKVPTSPSTSSSSLSPLRGCCPPTKCPAPPPRLTAQPAAPSPSHPPLPLLALPLLPAFPRLAPPPRVAGHPILLPLVSQGRPYPSSPSPYSSS